MNGWWEQWPWPGWGSSPRSRASPSTGVPTLCPVLLIWHQQHFISVWHLPTESFTQVEKCGLTLLVTTDPEFMKYLNNAVQQLRYCLYKCSVQKCVVVILNIESGEVHERWQFDTECDKTVKDDSTQRKAWKFSKMKSTRWSDRSQQRWHVCHCWKFLVHLICGSMQILLYLKSRKSWDYGSLPTLSKCVCVPSATTHKVSKQHGGLWNPVYDCR